MKYEEVMKALMIVDKLKTNDNDLPEELLENKELIIYADQALRFRRGEYNYMYPLLRVGLSKQFEKHVKDQWLDIVMSEDFDTVLDVGCGDGAYLNAIPDHKKKFGIDNKNVRGLRIGKFIQGEFPDDIDSKFDLILMNEFLHLFQLEEALNLISDGLDRLNEGGRLIIVENNKDSFLEYRLRKLGGGRLYSPSDFTGFSEVHKLKRHWIGVMKK